MTDARRAFLDLRREAGLPQGGETLLKDEVVTLAEQFGIKTEGKTKKRLIYELLFENDDSRQRGRIYPRPDYTWEDAQEAERDFNYLQAREAHRLAAQLADE